MGFKLKLEKSVVENLSKDNEQDLQKQWDKMISEHLANAVEKGTSKLITKEQKAIENKLERVKKALNQDEKTINSVTKKYLEQSFFKTTLNGFVRFAINQSKKE